MIAQFTVIPLGSGPSLSKDVARAVKLIDESGLPYKATPMGTVVEGSWTEVMRLAKKCHDTVLKENDRVLTTITIDDRKGAGNALQKKIGSVEKRLGKKVKK